MLRNPIPLAEVPRLLPGRTSPKTVHRWVADGLHGGRVKLKSLKIGGRRYTTPEWLREFVASLNRDRPRPDLAPSPGVNDT
jgi:hypothetical protein